ncbi:MAG: flagellar basal body-associated protein FliL [Leptonema sp. (in: bacteria)]
MAVVEEEQDQEQEIQTPPPTSGLNKIVKILIYVALGLVGLIIMSIISYYVAKYATTQQYKEVASIAVVKPPPPLEVYNFSEDFRVNTADKEEAHFIKLKLSLGFEPGNKALSTELAQRAPQLRNIINLILAGKTKEQLSTIEGQLELREEIKASINHVLSEGKIEEVYFSEFIIN